MLHLGLLGFDIQHSLSHKVYEKLLGRKIKYTLFDYKNPDYALERYFETIDGLSITSPHKQLLLESVIISNDRISKLKAINCIKKVGHDFFATNTDFLALEFILEKYLDYDIVILGNGIMSKMISVVLNSVSKNYSIYSGSELRKISILDFRLIKQSSKDAKKIIINTCSRAFVLNATFSKGDIFYDLNYSFNEHLLLSQRQEISYIDGIELLELQAKFALEFWNIY